MASDMNLQMMFEYLRAHVAIMNESVVPQFIQMAINFENCRRRCLRLEQEIISCKEGQAKAQTEKGTLEVQLKHARNQVDVEIRRRQKAEAVYEKLDRQMQLIRDLLVTEGSRNSIQLNEEQQSALAYINARSPTPANVNSNRRLTIVDESASILSCISYDKTDDSLQNESLVAKTTITLPKNGDTVEAVTTLEGVPYWTRSRGKTAAMEHDIGDTESVQSVDVFRQPSEPEREIRAEPSTPQNRGVRMHEFVSKMVIKPESCVPCGKRIKFGKISLKCKNCCVVTHPECRERCALPCVPSMDRTPIKIGEGALADYVSDTPPMIPSLVVHCVNEIVQRGMHETGLYRRSAADRTVKELKEKFLRGKTNTPLRKVEDIHAITGLLKDFLRTLKEPLLTFRLHCKFMDAAALTDDDNSFALIYQIISELPQPNRETLAFLVIHLQRVAGSSDTKMDESNLARVFGPSIVGHATPDPDPMTILQDVKRQHKVVARLLSLPVEYWSQFLTVEQDHAHADHMVIKNTNVYATPDHKVSIFGPITTPEQQMSRTPPASSLSQRMKNATLNAITPKFGSKSKSAVGFSRQGNFFACPLLK